MTPMNPSQSTTVGALTSDHVNLKNGCSHHHMVVIILKVYVHINVHTIMMVIILKVYDNLEVPL